MEENFEQEPGLNVPSSPYSSTQFNQPPSEPMPRKRSPKKFLYLLGAVVIILILLNVVRFIGSNNKKATPSPTPVAVETSPSPTAEATTSPSPTASPTSTPSPSINPIDSSTGLDRSKLSVAVQNGSGEAGVGAKATTYLKGLGYNVVSTGNADNFNYTNVTIKVKDSQKAYLPLLKKDLGLSYSVGSTSSDLTATSSADALVIVGK